MHADVSLQIVLHHARTNSVLILQHDGQVALLRQLKLAGHATVPEPAIGAAHVAVHIPQGEVRSVPETVDALQIGT